MRTSLVGRNVRAVRRDYHKTLAIEIHNDKYEVHTILTVKCSRTFLVETLLMFDLKLLSRT